MKKPIYGYAIALFSILLIGIGIVQFLRLDYGHRLIPNERHEEMTFETLEGEDRELNGEPIKIYIHQNDEELSKVVLTNFKQALHYAKLPYAEVTANEIASLTPSPQTVLVLGGENSDKWPYETIERFVDQGGRLYVTGRFADPKWADLVGVKQFGDFLDSVPGLTFEKELFPGYVDLPQDSELFVHSILDVDLADRAEVMMTAKDEPILWSSPYGEGEVMYWNTTSLADKNSRGLLVQALSNLFPAFVLPQASIKVVHFDDFPAPVPDNSSPVIEDAYNVSIKQFYSDIWWKDMKQIAKDHDLVYTGFMMGSYQATDEETTEDLIKKIRVPMLEYGRGLLQNGGEIGLHGYNHQPLVMGNEPIDPTLGYEKWESREDMATAIDRVVETFEYYMPEDEIRSYVPPSNIIGESGLSVLNDKFPDGIVVAGLYDGDGSQGSYIQEFGPDPVNPNIYDFPRITSGYNQVIDNEFIMTDAVANFGLVSHFIHPDDVLDEDRSNGEGWEQMKGSLEGMFRKVHESYPHLQALTQFDAYRKYELYQESEIEVSYTEDAIEINGKNLLATSTMLVRVEEGKQLETGTFPFGTVRTFGDSGNLYQVEMTEPYVTLPLKEVAS